MNKGINPILKWAGGKRQLLKEIKKYIPEHFKVYHEPFLGGGAVLLDLQPQNAIVNDSNEELINVYRVIKDDVDKLIESLRHHNNEYERDSKNYFYKIRERDRDKETYNNLSAIERASRIIFLNKTCYNGLFRVNRAGQFNTPFGCYKKPNIVNEKALISVNEYLNKANIKLLCEDFETALKYANKGDFVYMDPPYDPVSDTASFTGYDKGGFNRNEQIRLNQACHELNKKGIKFLLSNSATNFILNLYKDYRIEIIQAKRALNSRADKRGEIDEVLVMNFE